MAKPDNSIRVRGARQHNLRDVDVDIPRDALVVCTGISGSGKSSFAFGTVFAESQRRYLDSLSPYARRLIEQVGEPEVDSIEGLPPAVALQQRRGSGSARSTVGSLTTLSNSLRMLYSRAGTYPRGQGILYADAFSPNTPKGACPRCHGIGKVFEATERLMVPDPTKTIREKAIAAWPPAWQGQNFRDILVSLGYDIDRPWNKLKKKDRDWILYTKEQPVVPVYAGYTPEETVEALEEEEEPSYMGTFQGVRAYVMNAFRTSQSARTRKRVAQFLEISGCPDCKGDKLTKEALSITFAGLNIAALSRLPMSDIAEHLRNARLPSAPEKAELSKRICRDIADRIAVIARLGLGYLPLERTAPTLSPGELQRLRLATQLRSRLFGVLYVLDEPSAGLHPRDTEALLSALEELKDAGNSVLVVEHNLAVIEKADWIIDLGPEAGTRGGEVLYSGPLGGLRREKKSITRAFLDRPTPTAHSPRTPTGWLELKNLSVNNVVKQTVKFPLGAFSCVVGVSGAGKSSLVSHGLVELLGNALGQKRAAAPTATSDEAALSEAEDPMAVAGTLAGDVAKLKRLVFVDQKPIGRTPRSNLATYTGLLDPVRHLFAKTKKAKSRRYDAGRFSFNVAKGRCATCEGAGFVSVELLFLPSVYSPCPTCAGQRYNEKTLEVLYRDKNIADVLAMTVEEAHSFFTEEAPVARILAALLRVGLGYLRLGQPATELSGGEAQRIKLAKELSRPARGDTMYVLDEPTTGLHPSDAARLTALLQELVDGGNSAVIVEHDMAIVGQADWVIEVGPGPGSSGGTIVCEGRPKDIARSQQSVTAPYLRDTLCKADT